ncbi:unnamed protein product [Caenorhabditis auriculariae]|uniref:Paired domain-containing protein n=1 Tax=Caenorhabditis auriculariae TaxID=2777116 RepID=A0A8S1HKH5_9PELO|nr:unnamed protein product [Caenorhabditis auriculariae]
MVAPSPYPTAIIDCVKSGMTNSEIVKKLKVSRVLVFRTAQRYRHLGTSDDIKRRGFPVTVTTPEAVKAVREKIRRTPERSMRKMSEEYEMSRESIRTIVKDKLKMIPYRMQKGAFLNQKKQDIPDEKGSKAARWHERWLASDDAIYRRENLHCGGEQERPKSSDHRY